MGGPNLEVFKFAIYLFVPIAALVHFGDPDWYRQHVVPVCAQCFPIFAFQLVVTSIETNYSLLLSVRTKYVVEVDKYIEYITQRFSAEIPHKPKRSQGRTKQDKDGEISQENSTGGRVKMMVSFRVFPALRMQVLVSLMLPREGNWFVDLWCIVGTFSWYTLVRRVSTWYCLPPRISCVCSLTEVASSSEFCEPF